MPAVLGDHSYGKSRIRLTKVTRRADRHDVRELSIDIALEGGFERSYTHGDNRLVIPTDTMKNVAFALAKQHPLESIEELRCRDRRPLPRASCPRLGSAVVRIAEQPLERIRVDGREHPHAFSGTGSERRTSTVTQSRGGLRFESGLEDLFLLKSTGSAFCGFLTDRYTTLKDAPDRILATMLDATWLYQDQACELERIAFAHPPVLARGVRQSTTASPCSRLCTQWARPSSAASRGREDHAHHAQQASHPRRFETIRPRKRQRDLRRHRRALRLDHRHALARLDHQSREWNCAKFDNRASVQCQHRPHRGPMSRGVADSSGRWLIPPLHGMKIIPVGATRAMKSES